MDELTRERYGPNVPWHERTGGIAPRRLVASVVRENLARETPAVIVARRRVLCGHDQIRAKTNRRLLRAARLESAMRRWQT